MDTVQCQNCKFDYKSEKGVAKRCPSCSSTFWVIVKTDDMESIPFESIKPSVEEDFGKSSLNIGSLSRQNMTTTILTQKSNPQLLMYIAIGLLATILLVLVSMGSSGNSGETDDYGLTPGQIRQNEALYQECLDIAFNNNGTIEEQTKMVELCGQIELD